MGCYINPEDESKEVFLNREGELLRSLRPTWNSDSYPNKLLVCWINNGPFTAAGVCYNEDEFEAFSFPGDYRPKLWFLVDRLKLKEVSPIDLYLEDSRPPEV